MSEESFWEDVATVQAVTFGQDSAGFAGALPDESVVDVLGKVACPEVPIASCTVQNVDRSSETKSDEKRSLKESKRKKMMSENRH